MRIDLFALSEITFTYTAYPEALKISLLRAGLNFPIRIRMLNNGYICIDGNKRLSAIQDVLQEDVSCEKFQRIKGIVEEYARSAAPYTLHNHH